MSLEYVEIPKSVTDFNDCFKTHYEINFDNEIQHYFLKSIVAS